MKRWPEAARSWSPPPGWRRVLAVDAHAGGEPLRVILEGFGELRGDSILARRRDARLRHDAVRTALMWEPRGHPDMYGCLLVPPVTPAADVGVLFTHNEGYSTMCGHGIIAVTTVLLELGLLPCREGENRVGIDTPAGFVEAWGTVADGRVVEVSFVNVASFAAALDRSVEVPGMGPVRYDLGFGGAFYAFVDAPPLGLDLVPAEVGRLIDAGRAIKAAVAAADPPRHPLDADLSFLYGTIFVGPPHDPAHHSRNVCVFADGEVDRSPTGTGVSARLALHHARGELAEGREIVVESILGTTFGGRVVGTTRIGPHDAIVPRVSGSAHITGRSEWLLDPDDPLRDGFLLR
ncbi:MAG TPA: proline racemase family protein [Longimicrobiales bacterium]|nr:proline racemase family protein [Longimicrobiales bacterium]